MELTFKTNKLKKQCNEFKESVKTFGEPTARKLNNRLNNLRAAATLMVMQKLPGRCHELKGPRKGQLSLDLVGQYRLIFIPNEPYETKDNGRIDWSSVKSVKITGIEDTHE
ncbi:MAG: killer suppression protein [Halobacteriovoraceae bacterium]|nr:killer suppression protein [Halobacteriovoraceae bacterium]MCB9095379.1 killer suppression protein [Halobacteriovoraceae bacterium]